MDSELRKTCEAVLQEKITNVETVSGGSINHARRLQTGSGDYFLKFQQQQSLRMFEVEAKGLESIAQPNCIKTPEVIGYGGAGRYAYLLLEFLPPGPATEAFWQSFGRSLANLHRTTERYFGLDRHNYIGSLPQSNSRHQEWIPFFKEERIAPQVKLAVDQGLLNTADLKQFEQLYALLPDIIPQEPPALIHGDLWSGNFLSLPGDQAALIDPAVCFAHREMDLAMSLLFGGFSPLFYEAYHETFPLEKDWQKRMELYQLYYLLVHVNLFGTSYVQSVRSTLRPYI